jgi:hypothetical protein
MPFEHAKKYEEQESLNKILERLDSEHRAYLSRPLYFTMKDKIKAQPNLPECVLLTDFFRFENQTANLEIFISLMSPTHSFEIKEYEDGDFSKISKRSHLVIEVSGKREVILVDEVLEDGSIRLSNGEGYDYIKQNDPNSEIKILYLTVD